MSELPVITLVDASVATTGALVAARNLARGLADDARVVLILPESAALTPEQLPEFARVGYLPLPNPSKQLFQLPRYVVSLVTTSLNLRAQMQQDGSHCLILNDFYLLHGVLLRLMGYRGKIIQWVRCDPEKFGGTLAKPMLFLTTRAADHVIAVSQCIAQKLTPSPKLRVIYDAYTGPPPVPRPTVWPTKPFVFIGNYIAGKGQDVALEAFALAAKTDASLRLQFFGGDMGLAKNRAYRAALEARARELGIADKVTFGGFVHDLSPVLNTAYAALNFSTSESFSMTVLEASGAGLPVIATRSGGPEEIIEDGVTGYLIPIGDAQKAAEKILTLAEHPDLAATFGTAGAARAQTHFFYARFASQLRSVLT